MKPNLSPIINPNITKISPVPHCSQVLLQKIPDLPPPKSSTPTLDQSLISPNKKTRLHPNSLSQKQKNFHDQITKFDFSFKKKQFSDSKKLAKSLLSDLSVKLGISEDSLDTGDLESILGFRSRHRDRFIIDSGFKVSQSTLILCLLLRGKLRDEVSLMEALRKIWGKCVKKRHIESILKAADYRVITSSSQNCHTLADASQGLLKKIKVKFAHVSLFQFCKLKLFFNS